MYCHGWYTLVKQVERHTKSGEKSNNYRKLHGVPLKRITICGGSTGGKRNNYSAFN